MKKRRSFSWISCAIYRHTLIQAHLRRRREMSHGRSDSENSSKTRRCRGCTRGCPYHVSPVSTWENSISPRRIAKWRWQSQGGKLRNCFLQARCEPTVRFSVRLDDTYRIWNIRYVGRFRRQVVNGLEEEKAKVKGTWWRGKEV